MMKIVTLSTSSSKPLLFGSFSNTLPHFSFRRRHSLSFLRNSGIFYPRYQSKQHQVMHKEFPGDYGQTARLCNGDCCYEAAELDDMEYEVAASYLSTSNENIDSRTEATAGISALTMDISSQGTRVRQILKFVFLFGSLNVLGAAKASAASNFVDSLQSVNFLGDLGDISTGFASAFLLIFFSELGDKTFFIAALLAARNSAAVVFAGTFGALGIMTVISVVLGRTFHYIDGILPFSFGGTDLPIDDIAAVGLLVYFGVTTLIDATSSDSQKAEDEQKEVVVA